jgi:FkbM family methyltransferase
VTTKDITITVGDRAVVVAYRPETTDKIVLKQVFQDQAYNTDKLHAGADIRRRYQAIVARGEVPLILDLGANMGASPLWFNVMWPAARIVAVEPEAANFAVLCTNVAGCTAIVPVHAAAASCDGLARIQDDSVASWSFRTEIVPGGDIVARAVPSLIADAGPARPFICKIDIEGAEGELFSGDVSWVDAFELIIIETHDWKFAGTAVSRNFLKAHVALDRDLVQSGENLFSLANRR